MTPIQRRGFRFLPLVVLLPVLVLAGPARADDATQQTLVHMLGYIGVDYPQTVADGKVMDAAEYAEQQEFAGRVKVLIDRLPAAPAKPELQRQAIELGSLIDRRVVGDQVAALTERMRAAIVDAYKVVVAPRQAPDLARGAALYQEQCAACHGAGGRGDGALAATLEPRPNNFHDRDRQRLRSIHALYNTISLGVEGTAMPAFAKLDEADRWALAFHVANFYASDSERGQGMIAWTRDDKPAGLDTIAALTQATPAAVAGQYGETGAALLAYLRAHPSELVAARESPLAFSARTLDESFARYREGQREAAYTLAVTAYLEGFELAETGLATIDSAFKTRVETEMFRYRAMVKAGDPVEAVGAQAQKISGLLAEAREKLDTASLSPGMALGSSFVILLREGMEAILLLAAIIAFLIKTGRRQVLRYVHAGWIAALMLGGITWWVASYMITISGASRELTEGIAALLAAGILFYVGVWLHNKLQAHRWKQFIDAKVQRALSGRTVWALAFVSFIAVYREVFETVLFYQALWVQAGNDGQGMVVWGFVAAALALVAIAWGIFRFSLRLPLKLFFGVNSALLYLLAVVFAGKGVAALQEAGKLPISAVDFPRIDLLGIYPNLETLGLQALLITIAVVFVIMNRRAERRAGAVT